MHHTPFDENSSRVALWLILWPLRVFRVERFRKWHQALVANIGDSK